MVNAVSAVKMLLRSKSGLQSITITPRKDQTLSESGAPYVQNAIGTYSDGTEIVISFEGWPTISIDDLSNGLFLPQ